MAKKKRKSSKKKARKGGWSATKLAAYKRAKRALINEFDKK